MTILWWIFEILVNIYQGFISMYFVYSYLGDRDNRKFFKSSGIFFATLLAAAITILNVSTSVFEHFLAFIYVILIFLYAVIFLKGSLLKKLFSSVFIVGLQLLSTAFVSSVAVVLSRKDMEELMLVTGIDRFIVIIAVQLTTLYLVFLSLRLLKISNKSDLSVTEWILISIILIISIAMCALLILLSISPVSNNAGIYTVLVFIGILVVNIVVCYLLVDLGRKNVAIRENEVLRLSQEYNRQYIDNATAEYDTIKKIQHDFKNSYSTIYNLIKSGNIAEANKQIESNLELLQSFDVFVKSNNAIVDTVVNAKLTEAKSFGIDCTCICGTGFESIDNLDLCRLLSNMLENAVTSCVTSKRNDKQISLILSFDGSNYIIDLKNSVDESVLTNNPELRTTKDNQHEHGYGVKIIKDIAKKYNGLCDFYEEGNIFCCKVVLCEST